MAEQFSFGPRRRGRRRQAPQQSRIPGLLGRQRLLAHEGEQIPDNCVTRAIRFRSWPYPAKLPREPPARRELMAVPQSWRSVPAWCETSGAVRASPR